MNDVVQRLLRTGVSIGAGFVATRAVEAIWKTATGDEEAPTTDDDQATLLRVVTFATISAGVSALLEVGSQRLVNKAMSNSGNKRAKQLGKTEVSTPRLTQKWSVPEDFPLAPTALRRFLAAHQKAREVSVAPETSVNPASMTRTGRSAADHCDVDGNCTRIR